ncbi:DUF4129 domain-containing protein [Streptomyces sp. NPDC048491]|uniref:DUF4129 domain-containing protein n=1 Tax=unclassified Streptomyces TaxID=2593676 RepID=UPI00343E6888
MSEAGGFITARLLNGTSGTPPVDIGREPAREAARRELSDPAYHQNDPSLLQRGLNKFWDWVGSLFDSASVATPGGPLGLIVIVVAVIALIAALWWRLGTPHRAATSGGTVFDDRPRSAAEHRTAAAAHAAARRWNEAVQEQMRAIVRALEERALLDPRPGRTADEAAAEAGRTLPGHADRLHAAARAFDDVTYGGRTADEPTYLRLRDLDRDLERTKPALTDANHLVAP